MSWSSIKALAFAVLAACNGLLGLEETLPDRDRDGIPDVADNCVDVANPDQFDSDNDGLGDACSLCGTAIGRDLDHDGYDDACDRCIGPGALPTDEDGDGLPDGCDPCLGGTGHTGIDKNVGGVGILGEDQNGDGVDDGCTVCFQPVGVDEDNDGLDDACDACIGGPPHDEDGDGLDDACDNCPGDSNATQFAENDLVGVACDPDTLDLHQRVLFDPFLVDLPSWTQIDPGWTVQDDVARVVGSDAFRISELGLAASEAVRVVTLVELGPASTAAIHLTTIGGDTLRCEVWTDGTLVVTFTQTGGLVITRVATMPVDTSRPVRLELRRTPFGLIGPHWDCSSLRPDGIPDVTATMDNDPSEYRIGLHADGDVTFYWLDAIGGR